MRWIALVLALAGAVAVPELAAAARQARYVEGIYVYSIDDVRATPEGQQVKQAPYRNQLDDIFELHVPNWRNLWFPVLLDGLYFEDDTAAVVYFYRNLGYLDARLISAGTEPHKPGRGNVQYVNVVMVLDGISPTDRYRLLDIQFDGVASLDTLQLAHQFRSRHPRGQYFSPAAARQNYVALGVAYADAGFLDSAAVIITSDTLIDAPAHTVIERYQVQERAPIRVAGVQVRSEKPLQMDTSVVVDALHDAGLRDGNLFRRRNILTAERYLLDLGTFSEGRITPSPADPDSANWRYAVVDVSERPPGEVQSNVGYSTLSGWQFTEAILYHNFLGRGLLIGEQGRLAKSAQTIALLYGQPRIELPRFIPFFGSRSARVRMDHTLAAEWLTLGQTVFASPNVSATVDSTRKLFTRSLGWTVAFTRAIGPGTQAGVSLYLARTDILKSGDYFGTGIASYQQRLTLGIGYDTRDDYFRPTRGTVVNLQAGFSNPNIAPPRINFRPELVLQYFRPLRRHLVGALMGGGGFYYIAKASQFDPTAEFWRSPQTPTVRGYLRDDITVGPSRIRDSKSPNFVSLPAMAYILGKAELRLSLWRWIGAATFFDAGRGWAPDASLTDTTAGIHRRSGWSALRSGHFVMSAGFGPRIYWVLPMRLDIAYALRKPTGWKVEFGIGQAF